MYGVETHKALIEHIGEGALADALLKKWLADPDGLHGFVRLADDIYNAPNTSPRALTYRKTLRAAPKSTYDREGIAKWRVILWYLSMGHSREYICEILEISIETMKQHFRYAKHYFGFERANEVLLVSTAIRQGLIP